jgi:hypothetical protein
MIAAIYARKSTDKGADMTEDDAKTIELAAVILLRCVGDAGFARASVTAALRNLYAPSDSTLRRARALLETTAAWKDAK